METLTEKSSYMEKETNKLYNLDELKKVSGGDEKFISEMIQVFIKITEGGITEIDRALKEGQLKLIADSVHKIMPSCRYIGATILLEILKKIQEQATKTGQLAQNLESLVQDAKQEVYKVVNELKNEAINIKLN